MKHLKLYEDFNWSDEDFDFEDENPDNKIYSDYITEYTNDDSCLDGGHVTGKIYYIQFSDSYNLHKFTDILDNDGYYLIDNYGNSVIIWSDKQYNIGYVNSFNKLPHNGTEIINGDDLIKKIEF